ncbi:alpha/beta fold hydrolase [uncultured Paludibaculum sp.]|uniref:alpha/beta hydrolase n=1 Tax=uncultured Paludibaculum sp. TaxID=1765020 RepID=UPI002AABF575|nr:alpha/beta fold hydrolase [uncultured Paludibaculum sp.]
MTLALKSVVFSMTLALAACQAQPRVEVGEINGAAFRIDVPAKWTGVLVVYCHGYNPNTVKFAQSDKPQFSGFVDSGVAVIQSGYAAGGWAVEQAIQDTEALRRYFTGKYGKPVETYVMGHSMGGFLTMTLLEKFPNSYDGGLALCGPLGSAEQFMERRVFDMRVVFDYYFPGALPNPAKVPADFRMSREKNAEIEALLNSKPEQATAMRQWAGIPTNRDLAGTIVFWTYILLDLQQRGGGNPFDNHDTIYSGTPDDNKLNDGVARYTADPRAAEYIRTFYTPSGRLTRPMLAIHTTYDPLVPPWVPNGYADLTRMAGAGQWFAQQYVKHGGHCAITSQEMERGFHDLQSWKATGKRPIQPTN